MKILHLADIHIKNSRFVEYDYVFDELYKKAKILEPDYIVVAGDIFDDKTSAEAIVINNISKFITNLSLIAKRKLILIQGNHDTHIEAKRDKRDQFELLTVILDILKPENTLYFKKTGIYIDDDVLFGVLDPYKRETLDLPKVDNSGLFKIGLFHEEMVGAKYFNGDVKNATIGQAVFEGYDIVLGGHIHKRQFLAPNIAYCGSLIQQNIGEFHTGHGFILWNDTVPEEHDIYNPYACVKIVIRNGINTTILPIPENPREWYLDTDGEIIEYFNKPCANIMKRKNDIIVNDNVFNEQSHDDIIRDILAKYDTNVIDAVIMKYKEENEGELRQRKTISLLSMDFSNLFCYGKNNIIDFTKLTGISGINSKNESGKSAIIRLILIGLYGKYGDLGAAEIVRKGEKSGSIKIIFIFGSQKYMIDRLISSSSKTAIYEEIDGEFEEIVKTNKTETENFIKNLLGNIDNVINSSFILNDHKLIYATPAERKVLLMNALNLNNFKNKSAVDECYRDSANKIKNLESQKKNLNTLNVEKEALNVKIAKLNELIIEEERNIKFVQDVTIYKQNISKLGKIVKLDDTAQIENNLSADELIIKYMNYLQITSVEHINENAIKAEIESNCAKIDHLTHIIKVTRQEIADLDNEINECERAMQQYNSINKRDVERYNVLSGINCCEKMREIVKNLNISPEILAFDGDVKIRHYYKEKDIKNRTIYDTERELNKYLGENVALYGKINNYREKMTKIANLNIEFDEDIYGKIRYLYDISVKYIKESSELELSHENSMEELAKYKKALNAANIKLIETDLFINNEITRSETFEVELKTFKFYEAYRAVLDPSGLISRLIDIRIKKIESIINEILNACADNKVTVRINLADKDGYKILFKSGDTELPAMCASGFRKMSISLAINLALWKITNGTVINGIFIDEGLSSCDKDNLISMTDFIRSLTDMDDMPEIIFLISHNEQVKSQIDNALEIEIGEHYNKVGNSEHTIKVEDKTYINCECGAKIKKSSYSGHKQTEKHKKGQALGRGLKD